MLGFPHEHEQFPASECPAVGPDLRGLTPPDPFSVMGYDTCEGIAPNQARLSSYDRVGAFYQYGWTRRRAHMMADASDVGALAYDGSGRAGLAWYQPDAHAFELWTQVSPPGQPLAFASKTRCADGGTTPCAGDPFESLRTRPVPLFARGSAADLDLIMLGWGPLPDHLLDNQGNGWTRETITLDGHPIPIVGAFGDGIDDQVLLHQPGPDPDVLVVFEDAGASFVPMNFPDYAIPLAGRYRGFGGGGNDILWYEPRTNELTVWQWLDLGGFEFWWQGPSDVELLGLQAGVEYVPLLGDFDGDIRTDVFWYAPGEQPDWLWRSTSNQDVVIFDAYERQVDGEYKPLTGDFDGDGIDDILWYSTGDELEGGASVLWYFDEEGGHESRSFSIHRDYTPIVSDFDGDACSDLVWYDPTASEHLSPVWRCLPGERDFACDDPIAASGYPVGHAGAY